MNKGSLLISRKILDIIKPSITDANDRNDKKDVFTLHIVYNLFKKLIKIV
jgi:hypothetical protein